MNQYSNVTYSIHSKTKESLLVHGVIIRLIMYSGLSKLIRRIRKSHPLQKGERLHWHLELLIGHNMETEEAIYPFPPELRINLSLVKFGSDSSLEIHKFPTPLKIDHEGDAFIYYHPYGPLDFTYVGIEESIIDWIKQVKI